MVVPLPARVSLLCGIYVVTEFPDLQAIASQRELVPQTGPSPRCSQLNLFSSVVVRRRRMRSVITLRYVMFPWTLLRNTGSLLSLTSQSSSRESGTASTACRAQKGSSTPKVGFVRQALLAAGSPMLVRLETKTSSRHSRNCGPMASRRIPLVLEGDFEGSQACGRKAGIERGSGSHLPNDSRESRLGSSPDPRRTSHARF